MLSRSGLRTAIDVGWSPRLKFSISTTRRACLHRALSTTQFQVTPPQQPSPSSEPCQQQRLNINSSPVSQPSSLPRQASQEPPPLLLRSSSSDSAKIISPKTPSPPTFTKALTLSPSLVSLLPHLTTNHPLFITAHLHGRPYLLTAGDTLRVPFLMPDVSPGDILRLNRASNIGSRDFTLKGAPYIDERMFECRVRVLGTEAEPMRIKEKTKRRQRHVRKVKSKHKYTILRVMQLKVKGLEELMGQGAEVVNQNLEGH